MTEREPAPRVILASASASRAAVLRQAGLTVEQRPSGVDEDMVKTSLRAEGADTAHVALTLADLKAQHVSRRDGDAFVIGADQMLECNGVWFDKPADLAHARGHLEALRGKPHELVTAAVVVRAGARVWQYVDRATLAMRPLSDGFIDRYLDAIGEEACTTVGGYRLEGRGAQLFSRVEGDFFTILGLPLLPLLDFLRGHGIVDE